MEDRIVIFTDGSRKILYNSIMILFSHTEAGPDSVDQIDLKDYKAAIVDVKNLEEGFEISGRIRSIRPDLPLLIINDFEKPADRFFFTKIKGFGQIRILNMRRVGYEEELLENTQNRLHPEYPSTKNDIAIILPVYNEEKRFNYVYNFVRKLERLLEEAFINATIYFVNDGSKDNTEKMVQMLLKEHSDRTEYVSRGFIAAQNLSMNTRKAGTYIEGIRTIDADILLFVDADDSFVIDDIALMINILREGYYDMVVGSKDLTAENRPPLRRLLSFAKRLLTKSMLPKGVYDSQTGLKAMKSTTAKYIIPYLHMNTGLAIDLEILHLARKLDFRVLQIPVTCIDREGSHVDVVKDSIAFLKNIFRIRKNNKKVRIDSTEVKGK